MKTKRISKVLHPCWYPSSPDDSPSESDWLKIDVDKYWKKVMKTELIHEISDNYFWQVTLGHMGLTDAQSKNFSKHFFTSEARLGRQRAIHGTVAFNRMSETNLVNAARAIWCAQMPDCDTGEFSSLLQDEEGRELDCARLGEAFARLVIDKDHQAFSKIAKQLKEDTKTATRLSSNYSVAWRGFCQFVRDNQTLPTRTQFMELAKLDKTKDYPLRDKVEKKLGLQGLPGDEQEVVGLAKKK